jgi:hypothetical protein
LIVIPPPRTAMYSASEKEQSYHERERP